MQRYIIRSYNRYTSDVHTVYYGHIGTNHKCQQEFIANISILSILGVMIIKVF